MTDNDLYNELDAITGGLRAFLDKTRMETWHLGGYRPFVLMARGVEDRDELLVGLGYEPAQADIQQPGDWVARIRVDAPLKTATITQFTGPLHPYGAAVPDDVYPYLVDLLQEMQRRRAAWPVQIEAQELRDGDLVTVTA